MSQFRIAHDFVHCTLSALAIESTKVTPHSSGAPERKAALRKVLRRMWVQEIDGRTFRDYLMLSWANWSQMCPAAGCRTPRRLRLATERWTNELLDWPWCPQKTSRPNHRKTDGQGNRHGPNFKPHGFLPVWASNLLRRPLKRYAFAGP